jgi:predicted CopG family antitoxin
MPSTTISLERSAYELLKSRKRPDESFSEEVVRLLGEATPSLSGFLEIISEEDGETVAIAIEAVRKEDLETAVRKSRDGRLHGRRS